MLFALLSAGIFHAVADERQYLSPNRGQIRQLRLTVPCRCNRAASSDMLRASSIQQKGRYGVIRWFGDNETSKLEVLQIIQSQEDEI